ncbi:amino acid ABC transporter substrate-binding protein [Rhodovulum sp. DZ06]|uniref:amino acid ABC transporter substrate-binding protein n=1 Tax=Rhodovulum sp. DZ06 TaxID=3425126 RepID=UPI003D33DFBB
MNRRLQDVRRRAARALAGAAAAAALLCGLAAAPTPARADALEAIAERGVLTLGYRLDAPPFSYRDEGGAPEGLAVALCAALASHIGEALGVPDLKVEWKPVTSQTRFPAVRDGEVDLHCGPTTQTIARRETLDFSIPYFIAGAGVVFRKGGAESLSDLTSEPVGVLAGTTTEALAPELLRKHGATSPVAPFPSHVHGLAALQAGEIEAYIGDQSILYYQLGRMAPLAPLHVAPDLYSFEPYALTMKRGETGLRLLVDQGLSRIYRSGEIYDHIRSAMGRVNLSPLTEAVYEVVAIPE